MNVAPRSVRSLNEQISYDRTDEGRWIGRLDLLEIEVFGDSQQEVADRAVAQLMATLRAMPEDEGRAWFDANTSVEPNPPFDPDACAAAYREAHPFPIEGLA